MEDCGTLLRTVFFYFFNEKDVCDADEERIKM
jgi:hypothetical protein